MKIKLFSFLILFITAQFLTGCVTLPHQIWRPWTRTIEGNAAVPLNSNLNISVKGSTLALVGNEELLQEQIKDKVTELVKRRGYNVVSKAGEYLFNFNL